MSLCQILTSLKLNSMREKLCSRLLVDLAAGGSVYPQAENFLCEWGMIPRPLMGLLTKVATIHADSN